MVDGAPEQPEVCADGEALEGLPADAHESQVQTALTGVGCRAGDELACGEVVAHNALFREGVAHVRVLCESQCHTQMLAQAEGGHREVKRRVVDAFVHVALHHSCALQAHADIEEEGEGIHCRVAGRIQVVHAVAGAQGLSHAAHGAVVAVGLVPEQTQAETGVRRVASRGLCSRVLRESDAYKAE